MLGRGCWASCCSCFGRYFFSVLLAYGFVNPIAANITLMVEERTQELQIIKTYILAYSKGIPHLLQQKLLEGLFFLMLDLRLKSLNLHYAAERKNKQRGKQQWICPNNKKIKNPYGHHGEPGKLHTLTLLLLWWHCLLFFGFWVKMKRLKSLFRHTLKIRLGFRVKAKY